jgi:glyoxylase-like metal-dependent hydrolase (beta-lactamase superfamily II)
MMNDQPAPPMVAVDGTREIADGVHVIPDNRVEFVPNIGIVVGEDSALVIDTAMGPRNGELVLEQARRIAGDRRLLLTLTHFHPEHGFAAQSFAGAATMLYNRAQLDELDEKGQEYIEMFSGFGPHLAELLAEVELVRPQIVYEDVAEVDLGGRRVELRYFGQAHTRGDQVVWLPEERILFPGDLVEDRFFPIFPDEDAIASGWLEVIEKLEQLDPKIVVPGHGDVGDAEMIRIAKGFMIAVRDRVNELNDAGTGLDEIKSQLEGEFTAQHPDWDNQMWIGSAVEAFHREIG